MYYIINKLAHFIYLWNIIILPEHFIRDNFTHNLEMNVDIRIILNVKFGFWNVSQRG